MTRPLPLLGDMRHIRRGLRAGLLTARDLRDACVRQTDAWEAQVGSFVERFDPHVRDGHGSALAYMPVGVKDVLDVAGYPTRAGCAALADAPPAGSHAEAVAALLRAGASLSGKLATHELAAGVVTPQTRNPRDLSRMAGGSSGGSAAAVACGMVMGALGTDTGGSVRIPAAFCGVVGFKPTYGAVSRRGALARGPRLDTVGVIGKSAVDAILLFSALARPARLETWRRIATLFGARAGHPAFRASLSLPEAEPKDAWRCIDRLETDPGGVWRGVCIGIPEEWLRQSLAPAVEASFAQALARLVGLGARVMPVNVPALSLCASIRERVLLFSFARHYRDLFRAFPRGFSPDIAGQIERGLNLSHDDYRAGLRDMKRFAVDVARTFAKIDVIATPTVPVTAPLRNCTVVEAGTRSLPVMEGLTRLTSPWNLSRMPAISLPLQTGVLPAGLQLAAPQGADAWLLRLAIAAEEAGVTQPAQAFSLDASLGDV